MKYLVLITAFIMFASFTYAQSQKMYREPNSALVICDSQSVVVCGTDYQIKSISSFYIVMTPDFIVMTQPGKPSAHFARIDSGESDIDWMLKNSCEFKATVSDDIANMNVLLTVTPTGDEKYTIHNYWNVMLKDENGGALDSYVYIYDVVGCTIAKSE